MKVKAFILYFSGFLFSQTAEPFYGSVYFDNNSDYIFITNTASLNVESNITIEAWLKSDDDNGNIIYRQNNTQNFDPYFTVGIGSQILRELGVGKIKLMGAPLKYNAISGFDLEVVAYENV